MALYYDLPVYRDTYKLILKIFEYTKDFPKDYKYTLGQDMKRDALQLVRSIYRANKSKNTFNASCAIVMGKTKRFVWITLCRVCSAIGESCAGTNKTERSTDQTY